MTTITMESQIDGLNQTVQDLKLSLSSCGEKGQLLFEENDQLRKENAQLHSVLAEHWTMDNFVSLLREIAVLEDFMNGNEVWKESDKNQILEEFDPWHTLTSALGQL